MDMAIKDNLNDVESPLAQSSEGAKVVYMSCTGPDTITYSREELHSFKSQDACTDALNELQDWLRRHAGKADLADLHEAISSALGQRTKK